jgi:BASS family bile acid:Na+ symporter
MEDTTLFATVGLPIALALIMGSLGLSLTPADFARVFTQPRGVLIGLANLFVVSPVLAFAVADLFDLEPAFAVGLVLLGASPGGATANLLTHFARGDTALSISMTALSSLAAVVTVPVWLTLAVSHFDAGVADDVSLAGTVLKVFAITVIPLAIGMWVGARTTRWQLASRIVAVVAFVVVVTGAVVGEWDSITSHFAALAIATLTLNVAAMAILYSISRLARLSTAQATAVAMELGIHNGALAITVGTLIDGLLAIPAAVYSAFQFLTAGTLARLMHRRNRTPLEAAA